MAKQIEINPINLDTVDVTIRGFRAGIRVQRDKAAQGESSTYDRKVGLMADTDAVVLKTDKEKQNFFIESASLSLTGAIMAMGDHVEKMCDAESLYAMSAATDSLVNLLWAAADIKGK